MTSKLGDSARGFFRVPVRGLVGRGPLSFALYLDNGVESMPVLYSKTGTIFDVTREFGLRRGGVHELLVRETDRAKYFRRLEANLDLVVRDTAVPVDLRAEILYGAACEAAGELFDGEPGAESLERAVKVVQVATSMVLCERSSFVAVRRVLSASDGLALHSVNVSMLSIGLARELGERRPGELATLGVAGLLHDVGRVARGGEEAADTDPAHCEAGARLLEELGYPAAAVDAARRHHERADGSGFPGGLAGDEIPFGARVVGLVDAFDALRTRSAGRISVYDCFRILGETYRGCFEGKVVKGFVKLFRS